MRRTALVALSLVVGCLPLTAAAQTDAEEITDVVGAYLTAHQSADREAMEEIITDPFVSRVDPFGELQQRETFLDAMEASPAPAWMTFGEFEPWIGEGGAYAAVPVNLGGQMEGAVTSIKLGVVLLDTEDGWKIGGTISLMSLDEESPDVAPIMGMVPEMMNKLQSYAAEMGTVAANGDLVEFLKLAHPDAAMGGLNEETGEMEMLPVSEIIELTEAAADDELPVVQPAANQDQWMEMGFGALISATNQELVAADGTTTTVRSVGMLSYFPDEQGGGEWFLIGGIQIPLP
ncbi:MAG: hypothetical protein GF320_23065 [Armatimonadia bacterium]|nr:hypothetical protein [Armatimonadia bacterium]